MAEIKVQPNKIEAVKELVSQFSDVKDFIFADYRGLTVEQITNLRAELRKEEAEIHVVKNNYAKLAFKQLEKEGLDIYFVGPTAVALSHNESGPVAKALVDAAKDTPLEVKGGYINGNIFDAKQLEAYSKLPTRTELIQKLMGTMNAPIQNAVFALNAVTTKLVRTLAAVAEQKGAQ
jgi:large subunit ribosomal protein L10